MQRIEPQIAAMSTKARVALWVRYVRAWAECLLELHDDAAHPAGKRLVSASDSEAPCFRLSKPASQTTQVVTTETSML